MFHPINRQGDQPLVFFWQLNLEYSALIGSYSPTQATFTSFLPLSYSRISLGSYKYCIAVQEDTVSDLWFSW